MDTPLFFVFPLICSKPTIYNANFCRLSLKARVISLSKILGKTNNHISLRYNLFQLK